MPRQITDIGQLWQRVSRQMHERLRSAFRDSCLPPMALGLLLKIERHPGVTVSDLARQAGAAKSHISRTTDQLVKQGYLEKRPDAVDQRLIRLHLTETATEVMTDLAARTKGMWTDLLRELTEDERATVSSALEILASALESLPNDE